MIWERSTLDDPAFKRPVMGFEIPASAISVCLNAEETIRINLQSVAMQQSVPVMVEHIVVDGASEDGTL